MIYKQFASTCEKVRVVFELPACLWADRIHVVGDFNGWQPTETPLKQDREGRWRAEVELPAGRYYEFRYLIDGKWHAEICADGARPNELGGDNSVLDTSLSSVDGVVRAQEAALPAARPAARPAAKPPARPGARPPARLALRINNG